MKKFLLLLLALTLLAACGPAGVSDAPRPLATPSRDWTVIKMVQTGGIMGLNRTLEVTRDGAMTITDARTGKTKTGQLQTNDLTRLVGLVAAFQFAPPAQPTVCADCFIYTIEVTSPSGVTTVQVDDVSLGDSGLEEIITLLRGTMDAALK
jgi:hypothetical protein